MDPFIAEIIFWPVNFAPRSYAFCQGQLMAISTNTALFSLVGTTYGGDGRSTFGLPNLQGRTPLGSNTMGVGPGLSSYPLGSLGGNESVTLTNDQMPSHNHTVTGQSVLSDGTSPQNTIWARTGRQGLPYITETTTLSQLAPTAMNFAGGGQPHDNMQPYQTINFCIALEGIFPSRN